MNKGVISTAIATFVAFMGIGVVDPLLPVIGKSMGASPFQVEWLFTSYIAVMSLAMLFSGWISTKIGNRRTLLLGLATVVVFSAASGLSPDIAIFSILRGGWGLGNALFTSTALSIIVGFSSTNLGKSITLYEAALGLGIASGPLLGGVLGTEYWRYPFFGTATLMAIGFMLTYATVKEPGMREKPRKARDIISALKNKAVMTNASIGLGYSYAFFTILAYTPLTISNLSIMNLGITYFLWGALVAFSSVVLVNMFSKRFRQVSILRYNLIAVVAIFIMLGFSSSSERLVLIVISGISCGIANALFTTLAIEVSPFTRSISSASYNFLRWSGAAIAPVLSGLIGEEYGLTVPFFITASIVAFATIFLFLQSAPLTEAIKLRDSAKS